MFAILVIVPLLVGAFAALALGGRPNAVKYIALAASLASLLLTYPVYLNPAKVQSFNWFSLAGYAFPITTYTYQLNMLLLALIAVMTPLIFLYSIGFMDTPSEQGRYYFEMCVFAAAMMLFAISGSFLTLLIGWELLGVTSYLLIGFWYRKEKAPTAARKAITIMLIGDVLMLIAVLLIWVSYHTFDFAQIAQASPSAGLQIAALMILVAAFTKSAQFPFHEWLPDAMEGPTPVSAFLHSSTMVKAGVFLVAALLPLFASTHLLNLVLAVGLISAVLGATNAFAEGHIKKVLAYSTIEDLGLMFVALGFNALLAAMLLFVVQTFYKALLFMGAGAVMKANRNEEQLNRIYTAQAGRPFLIATLIGALSIAGVFPLSGFFGKVAIEHAATNMAVYSVLVAISFASSLYIFRWLFVPLRRASGPGYAETNLGFKLLPKSMLVAIYMLAAFVVAGAATYIYLPHFVTGAGYFTLNMMEIATETAAVLLGLAASYLLFFRRGAPDFMKTHRIAYSILYNSMLVNRIYALVTGLFGLIAIAVDAVDRALYGLVKAVAGAFVGFAGLLRRMETGQPNAYITAFVLGLMAIVIMLML